MNNIGIGNPNVDRIESILKKKLFFISLEIQQILQNQ